VNLQLWHILTLKEGVIIAVYSEDMEYTANRQAEKFSEILSLNFKKETRCHVLSIECADRPRVGQQLRPF